MRRISRLDPPRALGVLALSALGGCSLLFGPAHSDEPLSETVEAEAGRDWEDEFRYRLEIERFEARPELGVLRVLGQVSGQQAAQPWALYTITREYKNLRSGAVVGDGNYKEVLRVNVPRGSGAGYTDIEPELAVAKWRRQGQPALPTERTWTDVAAKQLPGRAVRWTLKAAGASKSGATTPNYATNGRQARLETDLGRDTLVWAVAQRVEMFELDFELADQVARISIPLEQIVRALGDR